MSRTSSFLVIAGVVSASFGLAACGDATTAKPDTSSKPAATSTAKPTATSTAAATTSAEPAKKDDSGW